MPWMMVLYHLHLLSTKDMFKICVENLVENIPLLYRSGREKMLLRLEEKC